MKSPTVMCVDDDDGIRKLYGSVLANNGYEVIAASDGHHALHLFQDKEGEIDAVILDYDMPGMNGLDLAVWLKRLHPGLPVLMVSGSHPELRAMAPFVDAAMAKGVSVRRIVDLLSVLISSRKLGAREASPAPHEVPTNRQGDGYSALRKTAANGGSVRLRE